MANIDDLRETAAAEQAAVASQVRSPATGTAAGPPPGAHVHGGPPRQPGDARPKRRLSRDPDAFGVPNGREEEWRFTPLARMRVLLEPLSADGKVVVETRAAD